MSLAIVYYCPSAGGNHLKNLINLDPGMHDNQSLDLSIYQIGTQGAVHSRQGRNLHVQDLKVMIRDANKHWSICGHFGELAPKRSLLLQVLDRKFVILSIGSEQARSLLEFRQARLGQQCHAYWLHEEQPYLYDPTFCRDYWKTDACLDIPLEHFWNPDLHYHSIIQQLNEFLDIHIPRQLAGDLHRTWWHRNFDQPPIHQYYQKHLINLV